MAPKRKNDQPTEDLTSREKKKQKVTAARTIAVQPSQPATPSSSNASQPVAGPSKTVRIDSAKALPATLDVEKFAEARSFEINAMHEAMKSASRETSSAQARHTALGKSCLAISADARPATTYAASQPASAMDPMRKKILGRKLPQRGKERRPKRSDVFLNRQVDKKWLESHIWHAKRMKMENMWGYRLALHGSILHDASYWSLIQIAGPEHVLKALLESCCDPQGQGPGAKRFIGGVRACETVLYRPQSYPFGFIGPVTVIWRTLPVPLPPAIANTAPQQKSGKSKRRRSNKGKEKAAEPVTAEPATAEIARTVWIRCHPSMFKDAFVALKAATSLTLEAFKKSTEYADKKYDVEIANLNDSVNVFEIMGPKSSQIIKGALSPVDPASRPEFKKFWNSLTDLQSPGSVPTNMIIGAKVWDPRLNFPPKNAKPHVKEDELPSISAACTCLPSPALVQCDLWDDKTRERLKTPKYKKKELDARRAQSLIPGTPLKPTSNDNHVPIMLIQRSLSSTAPLDLSAPNTNPTTNAPSLHGWTLIVPRGWSMPFLTSLVYTGTRVGGQRDMHLPRTIP
ncbi:hypothetical protein EWM64_g8533 [Hericium alpestre]|uniref:Pop1 N-terminal domain-containing protein n=1 Tax=Hericium alpestre TaxID=135208 RepID=A0A4Y9ZN33_9AGAM|nr:hypothetical protein EWM64_g8533 [Hericium alpestre]